MYRNLVGSIYGRSCIKKLISFWFVYKHGRNRQFLFLIGRFLKIFSFETAWPNELKLGRKHLWKVQYKVCSKQNERWATQAQPTEPLVTIQTAYHLFWFLLQNVYHIFLVFFTKTVFSTLSAFITHFELFDYFYYTFPNDFFPLLKKMVPYD